jgi:transcriptional regulator with XRE-family HTH domain
MTLELLAEESGVSPTYLSEVERGERRRGLSLNVALRIARGMGTDVQDLLGGYKGLPAEALEAARLIVLLPRRSRLPILHLVRSLAGVRARRP